MRHLMQIGDEGARHRQINIYSIIQQMYQTCEHIAKAKIVPNNKHATLFCQ
jgi:hypothetical protein